MDRNEFIGMLHECRIPTAEEYERIEYVYMWHPCISDTDGKKQVVYLYKNFGMRIFDDMTRTAERAQNLTDHIREHEGFLADYKKQLDELKGR